MFVIMMMFSLLIMMMMLTKEVKLNRGGICKEVNALLMSYWVEMNG